MTKREKPVFQGGGNIALKVPASRFRQTVLFYRETLGLPLVEEEEGLACFQFGPVRLWVDCMPRLSHTEVWLDVQTAEKDAASAFLEEKCERCDEVEDLPEGYRGFWIRDPAGIVHLVHETGGQ